MSKILEIIMLKSEQHLESNNILAAEQFGFRKDVHIENAIFTLTDNILIALNRRQQVGGIICDLTKAFDCINHAVVLSKLYCYGIRGKCHHLFKSYLENRKQRVSISPHILEHDKSSDWETVTHGVPQGLILGPLLLIIYINDLPHGIHHEAIPVIYAVDKCILLTARNTEELKIEISSTLDYMIDWFSVKGLV